MKIPNLKSLALLKQTIDANASTDADDNTDASITITKEIPKTIIADDTLCDLAIQYAKNLILGKPNPNITKDWDEVSRKKFDTEVYGYIQSRFILHLREHEKEMKLKKQREKEIMQKERELEAKKQKEIENFKVPEYEDEDELEIFD